MRAQCVVGAALSLGLGLASAFSARPVCNKELEVVVGAVAGRTERIQPEPYKETKRGA